MKITTFILLCIISICNVFAQRTIKGEVLDPFENPLTDASIIIKGTQKGTTSQDGNFQLEVKKEDTLSISRLGYRTQEIVVKDFKPLQVLFEVESLDEVLVIGYSRKVKYYKTQCHTIKTSCGAQFCYSANFIKNINNAEPKLYPNPSPSGQYTIKFPKPYKTVSYNIITITGQLIQTQNVNLNSSDLTVDLSSFSAGIYLIQVEADGERLRTLRVLKG